MPDAVEDSIGLPEAAVYFGHLDVRLASGSNRVAIATRIAGLHLASESNLGVGLPDLRVDCVL
eukprot:1041020-Alexandrium_andersonii.AAC.1